MSIDFFVRNTSFFQTKRNVNYYITADIIMSEFNKLINFINDDVVDAINNLTSDAVVIQKNIINTTELEGVLIKNIGNSNVTYVKVTNEDLKDLSLSVTSLKPKKSNSIPLFNQNGELIEFENINGSNKFLTNKNNIITLRYLDNDFIEDNTIEDYKIMDNTLTSEHFINFDLTDLPKIENSKLVDECILHKNIQDRSITDDLIDDTDLALRLPAGFEFIFNGIEPIIKKEHIKDASIDFEDALAGSMLFESNDIGDDTIKLTTGVSKINIYHMFNNNNMLTIDKVKLESFNMQQLITERKTEELQGMDRARLGVLLNKSKLSKKLFDYLKLGGLK